MVRISPNTNPDLKSQEMLSAVKAKLGQTFNIFTTMSHSSAALGAYLGASGAMGTSQLSGALREQIALTVAGENACDYCASAHTALGKMQKVSEGELNANLQGKSSDSKTQAALTFASKIVQLRGHVTDSDVAAVRAAGYNDGEIVDIVAVVCINIFTNYFNHVAGTAVDFPLVSATKSTASV